MKVKLIEWMNAASGSLGAGMYAVPAPNEPGYVIVRRKPGKHDKKWKMKPNQERGTQQLAEEVKTASAIYNQDKAKWRAEFEAWQKEKQKHKGVTPNTLNGRHCTNPWEYCRIVIKGTSDNTEKEEIV